MIEGAGRRVSIVLHKFDRGGSPRVAAYLARGLTDRGFAVELILFTDRGEVEQTVVALMGADIPVHYLGSWNGPRAADLARGLPRLAAHLRARQPDAVIAAANNVALVTAAAMSGDALATSRLFVKTTNPIASSRHRGAARWLRRATYRRVFRRATAVWTLSAAERDEMRTAFPALADRFHEVLNPYVTPAMLDAGSIPAPGNAPRFILAVGRLTAQKRYERLIRAFALVRDLDISLSILGEGEERPALEVLVARLGLGHRVSMPGQVAEVAAAYRAATMLVLPSDYEGLPAVVLEAMAANCPVLCTDCFPAARALVDGAEGCAIIERTDAQALAALINVHLAQPRPTTLRAVAERYSIANGVASHAAALLEGLQRP